MAIAAHFDLELIQYDAVNAFVNAHLPYGIYMRLPPGVREKHRGKICLLLKALYGLKESPLLWQRDFTHTLRAIGFETVPHEPCCYTKDGVLIFFYVDDIILAFRRERQKVADALIQALQEKYTLTGGGALQWFLGIEVIRDRK